MDLRQLKALQAIAATGNFGEAADQLGVTQSALSHQVRQLEEELGESLLVRARPRTYASPAGRVVLESAARIMAELASLEQRFAQARHGPVDRRLYQLIDGYFSAAMAVNTSGTQRHARLLKATSEFNAVLALSKLVTAVNPSTITGNESH